MHSTDWYDNETDRTWTVHHNGDYYGEVIIVLEPGDYHEGPGQDVRIPFELMKHVVGNYLNMQMVGRLEQMSGIETIDSLIRS